MEAQTHYLLKEAVSFKQAISHHGESFLLRLGAVAKDDLCKCKIHNSSLRSNTVKVLGVSIFIVFCLAYGKLVWMNRFVKRQEVMDEEKRARIQELRRSGQIVEGPKGHDIPFGIRAIQSGVQVDGIWISSNTNTPVPSEIKLQHGSASSSEGTIEASESSRGYKTPVSATSPRSSRPISRQEHFDSGLNETNSEHASGNPSVESHNNRRSYQPRKSSQLRYDNHGVYDEETLGQLEGKPAPRKAVETHRPRHSRQIYSEMSAESSAADNEHNSASSSDSGETFSEPNTYVDSSAASQGQYSSHRTEYFPISTRTPPRQVSDPFITPTETRFKGPRPGAPTRLPSRLDNGAGPSSPRSPFVPGELHLNKSMRKVNPGFEVHPAGTFATPTDYKGKGVEVSKRESEESRKRG